MGAMSLGEKNEGGERKKVRRREKERDASKNETETESETHHLQIRSLAQKLLDRFGTIPHPNGQHLQPPNHGPSPILPLHRPPLPLRLPPPHPSFLRLPVSSLALLPRCHHQVTHHHLNQTRRTVVVVVVGGFVGGGGRGREGDFPSDLLGRFADSEEVGEEEGGEERSVRVVGRTGGRVVG